MNKKLITILLLCISASFIFSSKKCSSPPPSNPPTATPPTPLAPKVPHAIVLKNFSIPSEWSTQFYDMMANCPLLSNSSTIVTTEVIYYDASGNEEIFQSTTTNGAGLSAGPGFGDYNYSENLPYACEYFVRTTLKASTCQSCCGETHMASIGMNGEGCFPNSGVVPPIPDAGKPVLVYESAHQWWTALAVIEVYLTEFKCSCDCP
jgi:hypothetical protein